MKTALITGFVCVGLCGCRTVSDPTYTSRANRVLSTHAPGHKSEWFRKRDAAQFLALFPERRDVLDQDARDDAGYSAPVILKRVDPVYPFGANIAGQQGSVLVLFIVEADGTVRECKTMKATNEAFAKSAIECVKKWKFTPAKRNGVAICTFLSVPVSFELR